MTERPLRHRLLERLPWLLLLAAVLLVAVQVQRPAALVRVWVPWAEAGLLAIPLTAIIIAGGIDLSVGSIAALAGMMLATASRTWGWNPVAAALVGIATGVACGAANGGLVALGLSPLVATLATMATYAGLALTISGSQRATDLPDALRAWTTVAGVPLAIILLVVATLLGAMVLHQTPFGRAVFLIGDNRRAARMAAIRVPRLEWALYVASGLTAGLMGVVYALDRNAAVPDAHRGIELRAIACVVVGGTAISGGRGSIGQTVLGLAIVSLLDIGLEFLGGRLTWVTAEARLVVVGLLLILVAASHRPRP